MTSGNGHADSQAARDAFDRRAPYSHFRLFAWLGMAHGVVVGTVVSMDPSAATAVTYAAGGCAVLGMLAGVWYGFLFNIANHCTGGRILCGSVAGMGTAIAGTFVLALLWSIVGTVLGFAAGWLIGSCSSSPKNAGFPWVGAAVGAAVQAAWAAPLAVVRAAFIWGMVGTVAGPLLLLLLYGLSYAVLRPIGPPRHPFLR